MSSNSKLKFFHYSVKPKLFTIILLGVASLGLFEIDDRYSVVQQHLLPNLDFRRIGENWTGSKGGIHLIAASPTVLVLNNGNRHQTLMTQRLNKPQRFENIRVAVDIKLDGVEAGPAWWQMAGVIVLSHDRSGKRMTYWPSEVAFLSGTHPWRRYEAVIPTSASMANMRLVILHGGSSGEIKIRNLEVDAADERMWFSIAETSLLVLWLGVGIWVLAPVIIQRWRAPLVYAALMTFAGLLAVSVMPQPLLSTSSQPAMRTLAEITAPFTKAGKQSEEAAQNRKKAGSPKVTPPEKGQNASGDTGQAAPVSLKLKGDRRQYSAHFFSHILLGMLIGLAFKEAAWWHLAIYLSLAAATNELLQVFVITRSAGIADGLANVAGAASGLLIVMVWRIVRQRMIA